MILSRPGNWYERNGLRTLEKKEMGSLGFFIGFCGALSGFLLGFVGLYQAFYWVLWGFIRLFIAVIWLVVRLFEPLVPTPTGRMAVDQVGIAVKGDLLGDVLVDEGGDTTVQ